MKFSIPIYVEEERSEDGVPVYAARPLFIPDLKRRAERISRATARLVQDIREHLDFLRREHRHDALADCTFHPKLSHGRHKFRFELRQEVLDLKLILVSFTALDREIAFSPSLPEVWFDVPEDRNLESRAREVLTRHYLAREKDGGVPASERGIAGRAWVQSVDLVLETRREFAEEQDARFAGLGLFEIMSGDIELLNTGECLDWSYPDDLKRAVGRDAHVDELTKLLDREDRRPVLLMGARRVGKTTIVHECVHRRVKPRPTQYSGHQNVWHLSPQRLIAGMMYVGQWESRLLEIMKEASKQDHVLYFDDLLGLFQAGVSSGSDLSMGQVMRPHLVRREFRFLAEITPESFRVLRERDRSFADLFHVMPVEEPPPPVARRILVDIVAGLEGKHRCRFELETLPVAIDLQTRYQRDLAMPGSVAGFLEQLAVKYKSGDIPRLTALSEFQQKSGLTMGFIDDRVTLERGKIVERLGESVFGQPRALEAMADVVAVAKARLNDPERPLGSLLFLGPTGVGKTQSAKALASFLFGDEGRLLRFDMNEYTGVDAVARLVGTFRDPDGLLTGSVRRQPFSVVLLDEIEKAHPDVFDLLLQVLGEGRLTDSLGRLVDFKSCIVVLTSNLGVENVPVSGFGPDTGERGDGHFVTVAERFFRPELFNRIDRIVPFGSLGRAEMERITNALLDQLLRRDGLLQRRCLLQVEPEALERIEDEGFHPRLGARALKRTVEQKITRRIAPRVAEMAPHIPMVVRVHAQGDDVAVETHALELASRVPYPPEFLLHLDGTEQENRIEAALQRILAVFDPMRPQGSFSSGAVTEEQQLYFRARERVREVDDLLRWIQGRGRPRAVGRPRGPRRHRPSERILRFPDLAWDRLLSSDGVAAMREWLESEDAEMEADGRLEMILRELALLEAWTHPGGDDSAVLMVQEISGRGGSTSFGFVLAEIYSGVFGADWGLEITDVSDAARARFGVTMSALSIEGPCALTLARAEQGIHLLLGMDGTLRPHRVVAVRGGIDGPAIGEALEDRRLVSPVVRVFVGGGPCFDCRSGLATSTHPRAGALRRFLLQSLPLPAEVCG